MKKIYTIFILFFYIFSFSQVQVRGYFKKNGTYVSAHKRSAPNSTIRDNYSYNGNSNYNNSLPQSHYQPQSLSSSNYNTDKVWVNGYYKKDGTYVNGYYRKKQYKTYSNYSNTSNQNKSPEYHKKYVNTTKVNFRTSPETGDNIIGELQYSDDVTSISTIGFWDKINVKRYNEETDSFSTFVGYVNSRYLSDYSNFDSTKTSSNSSNNYIQSTNSNSKNFTVISDKAFFHSTPNIKNKKNSYLVYGEKIYGIANSKYFIYVEYENSKRLKTNGWILKDDLVNN